jgi:hypothetical protein
MASQRWASDREVRDVRRLDSVAAMDPAALGSDAMTFLRERCRQARPLASAIICAPINR